jgi:hypothetical protein
MWIDVIVEYVFGFLLGLLVFQSFFMRAIMGGTYAEHLRRSFMPELLSMNMMMAGMDSMRTTEVRRKRRRTKILRGINSPRLKRGMQRMAQWMLSLARN